MTQATKVIDESKLNVRWREEYISQGINRKTVALPRGCYRGLWLAESAVPDTNLNLVIDPDSLGMDTKHFAHIEDDSGSVSLSFTDTTDPIVIACSGLLPVGGGGATWKVWMGISYSTSATSAATIYVDDTGSFPSDDAVQIGEVVFAGAATTVEEGTGAGQCSFVYTNRQTPAPTDVSAYSSYTAGDKQWGMIDGEERHAIDLTKDMILGETKHIGVTAPATVDSGTQTGTSATVLTDVSKSWTINEHIGRVVVNTVDDSCGVIVSNAATTVTVTALVKPNLTSVDIVGSWSPSDTYVIYETKTQLTGWFYIGDRATGTAHQYFSAHENNVLADDYVYSAITGVPNFNLDGSGVYLRVFDSAGVQLNPSVDATNGFYEDPVLQLRSVGDSLWGDNPLPIVVNFSIKAFERESFVDLEQSPPAAMPNTGLYNYKKSGSSISMPEYQNQGGPLLLSADTLTAQVKEIVDAANNTRNWTAAINVGMLHAVNTPSDALMSVAGYHPSIGNGTWCCVTSDSDLVYVNDQNASIDWTGGGALGFGIETQGKNAIDTTRFLLCADSATSSIGHSTDGASWAVETGPSTAGASGNVMAIDTKYPASDVIMCGCDTGDIAYCLTNVTGTWAVPAAQPTTDEVLDLKWMTADSWIVLTDTGKTFTTENNGSTWAATTTAPSDVASVYLDVFFCMDYNPATTTIVVSGDDTGRELEFIRSIDNGASWTKADVSNITTPVDYIQDLKHLGGLTWVATGRAGSVGFIATSYDDGATWHNGMVQSTSEVSYFYQNVVSNGEMIMIADMTGDQFYASNTIPNLSNL